MDVCFVTPLKGWIVTEQTHILVTENGGKHWKIQFSDRDFILKAVSFADDNNGWASGEYGYIYHTYNGGKTWVQQAGYFDLSDETGNLVGEPYLYDITAVDSRTAWAVGIDGRVITTTNGGKHWIPVNIELPDADRALYYCVTTADNNEIFIGGDGVVLAFDTDGAVSRKQVFDPPAAHGWIYDIVPSGLNSYIAVGWEGAIYKKQENSSWKRINRH